MTRKIRLADIQADPNQPRQNFDAEKLVELGESIASVGQRDPILIKKISGPKKYQLINGERRWKAHCGNKSLVEAGTIDANVLGETLDEKQIFMEQLLDNANRLDLTTGNQITAYKKAVDMGISLEELSRGFGVKVKTIQKDLDLAVLPPAVIHSLDDGDISKELAASLLAFATEAQQLNGLGKALEAKTPKQALANVEFYRKQIAGEESKIVKAGKEDNESIKSAGRRIDKFIQQVGTFATFAESHISLAIKSRSREIEKLEAHAKALKKLAEQIQNGCAEYRAVGNKQ